MIKMSMRVQPVKPRRLSASKVANDNSATMWSGMSWTQQKQIRKRISDLEWQVKYTTMQLKKWYNLDNGSWEPLMLLRDKAQTELDGLISG